MIWQAPSPDISLLQKQSCLSKLDSTSPSVTCDVLNLTAMISRVFISTTICNSRRTRRLPSVHAFLLTINLYRNFLFRKIDG
ncbi:hypothetical protein BTN50_0105 [Candidatus Enterovibrio altilux]|uniref:Mobile element protein n=1 Tax=Candidatus Enterovibrio altilux TaxID=1927128 RepID=A0A291B6L8_9GAMM|nr:hypothetical protein BTN50_0105 [Candidatus Enterovibrio luxaltus]